MDEDEVTTLKRISDLAHCGGLAGLTEAEALIAIRRLTLKHWDRKRHTDQMKLDALDALRAAKAATVATSATTTCGASTSSRTPRAKTTSAPWPR